MHAGHSSHLEIPIWLGDRGAKPNFLSVDLTFAAHGTASVIVVEDELIEVNGKISL